MVIIIILGIWIIFVSIIIPILLINSRKSKKAQENPSIKKSFINEKIHFSQNTQ